MPPVSKGLYGGWHVYHTSAFEKSCRAAGAEFHRFQSVWSALRSVIVRDPSQGEKFAPGVDAIALYRGDERYMLPDLKVFYRYGNGKVVMIALDCRVANSSAV
ncbi:MAG TPA: hypothetical protein PKZ97_17345 [Azospirillaceae bacterium]|nr:hypothetical protein [Azospirillaceae bacterium]HRQ82880.1 hypothetical protein [Azospirillaceae bacterium]